MTDPQQPAAALPGVEPIEVPGFSYLPGFITEAEGQALLKYFGELQPLWETRHAEGHAGREGARSRRLTRPVYWLGAWQFASLGYYSEPDHVHEKCLQAEPFPQVMQDVLARLQPRLSAHQAEDERGVSPNTCLINYYGSELFRDGAGRLQPRDLARLRMHRDGEPGPVVMFSIGQPALFEFVEPTKPKDHDLALWLQDRSVVVLSGAHYKDYLYHRVTRVAHGKHPVMPAVLGDFRLRRVSVSFRFVPEGRIKTLAEFSEPARSRIEPLVEQLAKSSQHFAAQLRTVRGPSTGSG